MEVFFVENFISFLVSLAITSFGAFIVYAQYRELKEKHEYKLKVKNKKDV